MVENEAYGRPDGVERAPKSGTIKKIRLIAGGPGSFKLQIAKVKQLDAASTDKAQVVRNGPTISYPGQTEANCEDDRYKVESFTVNVPVQKGQYLALRGNVHLDGPLLLRRRQHPDLPARRCWPAAASARRPTPTAAGS